MRPEPGSWQHDLVELLEIFAHHEVPHLIAGGYAVAHAGHLRATKDVDIFVPRIEGASDRLALALTDILAPLTSSASCLVSPGRRRGASAP